jgi:hypothetical protein
MGEGHRQDFLDSLFLFIARRKLRSFVAQVKARISAVLKLRAGVGKGVDKARKEAADAGVPSDRLEEARRLFLAEFGLLSVDSGESAAEPEPANSRLLELKVHIAADETKALSRLLLWSSPAELYVSCCHSEWAHTGSLHCRSCPYQTPSLRPGNRYIQVSYVEQLVRLRAAEMLEAAARFLTVLSARDMVGLCAKAPSVADVTAQVVALERALNVPGRWREGDSEYDMHLIILVGRRIARYGSCPA